MSPPPDKFKDRWIEKSITELGLEIKALTAEQVKTRELVARLEERFTTKAGSIGGFVGAVISGVITGLGLIFHRGN